MDRCIKHIVITFSGQNCPRHHPGCHCTAPRRKLVGENGKRDLNLIVVEATTGKDGGEGEVEEEEEDGVKADVFVLVGGKEERAVTEWEEEEREEEFGSPTSSSPSSMAEWLYSKFLVLFRLVITTRGLPVLPTLVDGEGDLEGRGECLREGLCEEVGIWGQGC